MNLVLFSITVYLIKVAGSSYSPTAECAHCSNTEIVPTNPYGLNVQEVSTSLDIDTMSFESSDIFRIDYTIRSRWIVNQNYCNFYIGFLQHHGYFSEKQKTSDHDHVRLVVTEDVYNKFIWTPDTTCLSGLN